MRLKIWDNVWLTVSKNLIPYSSASAWPFDFGTAWKMCQGPKTLLVWLLVIQVSRVMSVWMKPLVLYPLALVHVSFVPYQDFVDIIWSVLFDITNPVSNVCNKIKRTGPEQSRNVRPKMLCVDRRKFTVEGWLVCDIIHQQNSHCSSVISCKSVKEKRKWT